MRSKASHPGPHYSCVPVLPGEDRFGPSALETSAAFAEARCQFVISRSRTRNVVASGLPAPKSKTGEEAATPGQPVALSRVSGCFPFGNSLRVSPLPSGSAAIIRQAQELSRFAEPTFHQIVAPGNPKRRPRCAEPVEDWTSLWKP